MMMKSQKVNGKLEGGIFRRVDIMSSKILEDYEKCATCENLLPHCHCRCPYCGERDKCECALFDAATGG